MYSTQFTLDKSRSFYTVKQSCCFNSIILYTTDFHFQSLHFGECFQNLDGLITDLLYYNHDQKFPGHNR